MVSSGSFNDRWRHSATRVTLLSVFQLRGTVRTSVQPLRLPANGAHLLSRSLEKAVVRWPVWLKSYWPSLQETLLGFKRVTSFAATCYAIGSNSQYVETDAPAAFDSESALRLNCDAIQRCAGSLVPG